MPFNCFLALSMLRNVCNVMRSSITLSNRILTALCQGIPCPLPAFPPFHAFYPKANNNNASASIHVHLGVSYVSYRAIPFPPQSQPTQTIKNHTHAKNLPIHQSTNQSPTTTPKESASSPSIHPSIHLIPPDPSLSQQQQQQPSPHPRSDAAMQACGAR